ncbi:MAG: M23 family metallopeptidase [Candidatus Riflebacteria bacterium]|nr:M23 family metallopeptidase [Candidatus Riflebacteria bacterium]
MMPRLASWVVCLAVALVSTGAITTGSHAPADPGALPQRSGQGLEAARPTAGAFVEPAERFDARGPGPSPASVPLSPRRPPPPVVACASPTPTPTPTPTPAPGRYHTPLATGLAVVSPFGMRVDPFVRDVRAHRGIDLEASRHQPVLSIGDGVVEHCSYIGDGLGMCVKIRHPDGLVFVYGHLQDCGGLTVRTGVRAGQIIGHVGSSGHSTGPHLHLEVQGPGGLALNPVHVIARMGIVCAHPDRGALETAPASLPGRPGSRVLSPAGYIPNRDRLVTLTGREYIPGRSRMATLGARRMPPNRRQLASLR